MNKQNIRKALNEISELLDQMSTGIGMDNAMDGSGECGGMILRSWGEWMDLKLNQVLDKYQVTLPELVAVADEWAKRELEMGPKQVWISMFSKKHGMYKETDYLDTRWGAVVMDLNYLMHA